MRLRDLPPGARLGTPGGESGILVCLHIPHPLYPGLALAVWRKNDGTWSLDALHPDMELRDEIRLDNLTTRLSYALHGGK